jgi:hypothetical protein
MATTPMKAKLIAEEICETPPVPSAVRKKKKHEI